MSIERKEIPNSPKDLLSLHQAIGSFLPTGRESSDYFHQVRLCREGIREGNYKLYLILNPNSIAPEDLSEDDLRRLLETLGPDGVRIRSINPRLLENGAFPLPLGGSCAIETWGMKLLAPFKKQPENLSRLAEALLSLAPTISHITGAILPAGEMGVHFIEDGLWGQRIEDEYKVEDGRTKTTEAYQRIHAAVERRAKLATGNPEYRLYPVRFEELHLLEGPLQRWFEEMGLDFDPNFGIAQVIYTYVGPELLNLVKQALIDNHGISPADLDRFNLAARLKQIDHNDWDATMGQLKRTILTGEIDDSVKKLLEKYPFIAGLQIARWIRDTASTNTSAPSGFFDLFCGGKIYHMENFFSPQGDVGKLLDAIKNEPRLLHVGNLREHIEYLREYLNNPVVSTEKNFSVANNAADIILLQSELQKTKSKINNHYERITILSTIKKLILQTDIEGLNSVYIKKAVDDVISRWIGFLKSIEKRYNLKNIFEEDSLKQLNERDLTNLFTLSLVVEKLTLVVEKLSQILSMPFSGLISEEERNLLTTFRRVIQEREIREEELINNFTESIEREIEFLSRQIFDLERRKVDQERELEALKSQNRRFSNKKKLPPFYPLSENLIIAYATQFTFDPDFGEFLMRVAEIQREEFTLKDGLSQNDERQLRLEDKKRKGQKIQELCQLIFPKLEAYLIYIFEGGDYLPIRFQSVFA